MNRKLENFNYSQNSINTYKSCPVKFKYKYIDKINWMKDDIESRGYYNSLKTGLDFHLLCERYFNSIPVGIDMISDDDRNKFTKWLERVKRDIPIEQNKKYLTEYGIALNLNGNKIQAMYDLIVVGEDSIEIWDWKTETRKINYKNVESRIQTIVYMFLAKEVIPKLFGIEVDFENVKMTYYQPGFEDTKISILYDKEKHKTFKNYIVKYVDMIKRTDFEDKQNIFLNDGDSVQNDGEMLYNNNAERMYWKSEESSIDTEEYAIKLVKNKKHCNYCEFNKLCNNKDVDFEILESEVYGT
ncbi:PD-(D/E)XK nuclease family protein [Metaclostridioides mangenotii]|uniref:PD-(D/E)XK nuclease family protein n=1 Tax=Metaclostridioides mangenotii TaxID=1540 RepID=UPI0004807228|nr:PD-(D/E)XK nuclease family protein [Clostridioides mangenotii]